MKGRLVLQEREGRVAGARVETLTLDRRGETIPKSREGQVDGL